MATTPDAEAHLTPLAPGDRRVIPTRSKVGFLTRIMFGLPVRGRYSGFEGELHVSAAGAASGVLRIEAETITPGIRRRDKHLRTTDFFAADTYPHLRFALTGPVPGAEGALPLSGTLHIRDRALPITTPVSVAPVGADELRLDADFEVDPRSSGFEFKRLPRSARVQASVTLERNR